MDQTNGRYIVSKEELQGRMDDTRHSMAETMGEIKHELSSGELMCSAIQERACWLGGAEACAPSTVSPLFRNTRTAYSAFRILDVPKNGGPGGFDSLGRGASPHCREDEAILERDKLAAERGAVLFRYPSPKGRRSGICSDQSISGG